MDVQAYLQRELIRRVKRNPRYSVRAFSRALDLDPSLLSKILNGRRRPSPQVRQRLVTHLHCSSVEVAALSGAEDTGSLWKKNSPAASPFRELSDDEFKIISDWHHYALFEILNVKGCRSTPRWMAGALGLSVAEVTLALRRMEKAGIIARKPRGGWVRSAAGITNIHGTISALPFRILQRQLLEKAIAALDSVPLEKRDQTSMTMAIDVSRLPEARAAIRRFRRDMSRFLERRPELTEVYNLSISLFPLSQCSEAKSS